MWMFLWDSTRYPFLPRLTSKVHGIKCTWFFTSAKSALHPGPWAEVKLSSWNQTVNVFPHQLQPLPGILYCDFSTEWTQHSRVIVHLTKTSTRCGMCSQMRPCIVQEINRIGQVFILLFCSSWTKVQQRPIFLFHWSKSFF